MWLRILWLLLYLAVFTNTIAIASETDDEDVSIEDLSHPKQPFYDSKYDADDSYYYREKYKKPTISEDAIFLPHEKYCQYFYAFDGRESHIFRCPSGYKFDAEKLQCLKSKTVSCGKRKKDVDSSEEKHIGLNFKCPKWSGAHPHTHYCHLFYYCQDKKPSLFMCPPGKLFDKKINGCLPQNQVKCEKRENPYEDGDSEDITLPDPESDKVYECPDKAGVYPDHEFCHKYIRCWYGLGELYVCPEGKLFDLDLQKCRSKNSVYCNDRINPYVINVKDDEDLTLIDEYPDFHCRANNGRFPHEECQQFYQCENGEAKLYKCPDGKMFDSDSSLCKIASEVTCNKEGKDEDDDDEFVCPAREGIFKDEEDCGSYYKCKKGKAQRLQCPEGELFDTDWKSCSDENDVTCGDRPLPGDEDTSDNEEESVIDENPKYKCEKRHGRFTHQDYCNWFYHCKDGRPSIRSCRRGRYYDSYRGNCYDEVDCGSRIPKTDYEITTPKPREFSCPVKSGKFSDPKDCGAYYVCEKYKHKHHQCPKGKLFHDKWLSCSDENLVTCGSRTHPDVDPEDRENKVVDPNPKFECKAKYGLYDHDEYCDWYYNCHDSKATLRECKRGKYYDSHRRKCYQSREVSCGRRRKPEERENPTTTEETFITKRPEFSCPESNGKFPHWRDCSKFYECKKWTHKEHKCPKHKLFDSRRQSCEDDNHVICDDRIHPDMDPEEPEDKVVDPNPKFACKNNYGRFTHDEYCHWYYNCHNKKATVRECKYGRYYDSRRRKCYDSKEVSCEGRKQPHGDWNLKTTTEASTTERPEFRCPESNGKFPHRRDCSKFYECKKWTHKELKCPKHKLFDSRRQSCEDDDHVICDERIHPEMDPDEPQDKVVDPNPKFTCKNNYGRFTHDEYCHWYYNCHNKKATVRECKYGRYYDTKRRKCYNSKEVSCEGREKPDGDWNLKTTTEGYITTAPIFQCPKGEGKYAHERDCGKYYDCKQWRYKVHNCPKRELFNEKSKKCEHEERVTCGNRIHPEDDPDEPEDKIVDPNPDFSCPSYFGRYDHRNCDYYYHCRDRRPSVRECRRGKYYDRYSRKCKNSVDVNCEDRIKPEDRITYKPEESTTSSQHISTTTKDRITTMKPPITSTSTTESEVTTKTTYPDATGRTENKETTVKSTTVSSINTETSVSTPRETPKPEISTEITDEPTTEFDDNPDKIIDRDPNYNCAGDEGDFAHDSYCHYYYSCQKNKVTLRECPEGKYFDIERGYCEDWYMVSCGDRLTPEELVSTFDEFQSTPYIERRRTTIIPTSTTTEEPTSVKPKFNCPSDGLYPHEKNCGKYYLCENGVAEEKLCPTKQLYDVEKRVCNEEQETNCGKRIHPNDEPDNPNRIPDKVIDPNPDFNCTERHGCMSHEKFCKWYYYCHDQRPEVRECSGDQYFDSARNKCLEWWMVFCDDRIVPEETTIMPITTTSITSSRNTLSPSEKTTEDAVVTGSSSITGKDEYTDSTTDNLEPEGSTSDGRITDSTEGRTRTTGRDIGTQSSRSESEGTGSTPNDRFTDSTTGRTTDHDRGTRSTEGREGSTSSSKDTGSTGGRTRTTGKDIGTQSTRSGSHGTGSTPSGRYTDSTGGRTTDHERGTRSTGRPEGSTSSSRDTGSTEGKTRTTGRVIGTQSTRSGSQGTDSTPSGRYTDSTGGRTTDHERGTRSTGRREGSTSSGRVTGSTEGKTRTTSSDIGTQSTRSGSRGTGSTPSGRYTDSTGGRTTDHERGTRSTGRREGSTSSSRDTYSTEFRTRTTGRDIGTQSTRSGSQGTDSTPSGRYTDSTGGRTTDHERGTRSTGRREGSTSSGRVTGSTEGKTRTTGSDIGTQSTRSGSHGTGSTPSGRYTDSTSGRTTDHERGTRSTGRREGSTSSSRDIDSTEGRTRTTGRDIGTQSTRSGSQGTDSTPSGRYTDSTGGRTTDHERGTRSTGRRESSTSSGRVTGSTKGRTKTTSSDIRTQSTRSGSHGTGSTPSGRYTDSTGGRTTDHERGTRSTGRREGSTSSGRVTGSTEGKTRTTGNDIGTQFTRSGSHGTGSTPSGRYTDSTSGRTTDHEKRTRSTGRREGSTSSVRVTDSTEGRTRTTIKDIGTQSTRSRSQGTVSTPNDRFTGSTDGRTIDNDRTRSTRGREETTTGIFTTDDDIMDKCKEEDGDFVHPDDCSKYYTCKDGEYSINECPSGTLFDKDMRICFREDRVDCDGRKKPEVTTDDCDEWLRTSTIADNYTTKSSKGTTDSTKEGTGGTSATNSGTNEDITTESSQNTGSTTTNASDKTSEYTESDLPSSSDSGITREPTSDTGLSERPTTDLVSGSTNSDLVSENFSGSTTDDKASSETGITGTDNTTPNIITGNTGETEANKTPTSDETQSTIRDFTSLPTSDVVTDDVTATDENSSSSNDEFESTIKDSTNSPTHETTTDITEKSTFSTNDEVTGDVITTEETSSKVPTKSTENWETRSTDSETGITDATISTNDNTGKTGSTFTTKGNESEDSTISTITLIDPIFSTNSESGENTDSSDTPISTNDDTETKTTDTTEDNESGESTVKTGIEMKPTVSSTSESGENTDSTGEEYSTFIETDSTDNDKKSTKTTSTANMDSTTDNKSTNEEETTESTNSSESESTTADSTAESTYTPEKEPTNDNVRSTGEETSTDPSSENRSPETTESASISVSEITTTSSNSDNPISETTDDGTTEDETLETRYISEKTPPEPEISTLTSTQSTESSINTNEVSGSTENLSTNDYSTRYPGSTDSETDNSSTNDLSTDDSRTRYPGSTDSETDDSNTNDMRTESNINTDKISEATSTITTVKDVETTTSNQEGSTETETTEHTTMHPCVTHTHGTVLPPEPTKPDCDNDDIDCIEKKTGDIEKWYKCSKKQGHFPHPHSNRIFIRCRNWKPNVKKCSRNQIFSEKYMRCIHLVH